MMSEDPTSIFQRSLISAGTQLNGIYEIDGLIASGGMGEVYKGHSIQTGDLVAIKVIRMEMAGNALALSLFRREASALHNLYSEAIVRYYVFSVDPHLQRPYLAMEYVEGDPLSSLIKQGPLPLHRAVALLRRVAAGLQVAHECGIIHRDVSPDNIIIPDQSVTKAKIIDFGIAKTTNLDQKTIIGNTFAGKFDYVSPEQVGLFGGKVTHKSDIYSLGLVLAEALRGFPIDMGKTQAEVIERRKVPANVGSLDPQIRPLIEKMLQPNPAKRPASMAEIISWPISDISEEPRRARAHGLASYRSPIYSVLKNLKMGGKGNSVLVLAALAAISVAVLTLFPRIMGLDEARQEQGEAAAPNTTKTPGVLKTESALKTSGPESLEAQSALEAAKKAQIAEAEKLAEARRQSQRDARRKEAEAELERQREQERVLRLAALQTQAEGVARLTREIQVELKRLNCFKGEINGTLDTPTKDGIALYLSSHGPGTTNVKISEGLVNEFKQQRKACPEIASKKEEDSTPEQRRQRASRCSLLLERAQLGDFSSEDRDKLRACQ
jgi:serine/threonine protein kinase